MATQQPPWLPICRSFDPVVRQAHSSRLSFTEEDVLRSSHWALGQDAHLREDYRFRQTPWGRWILAITYLANDALYKECVQRPQTPLDLNEELVNLDKVFGYSCVFCQGDPRFVLKGSELSLSARELSDQPLIEQEITEIEKYRTHLPLHTLKAVAASEPAGEWGHGAQEQRIETLGWLRVTLEGHKLNDQMFVAQIRGHSMDDGRSGLVNGGYAVFELWPQGSRQNLKILLRGAFTDPETGSYTVKKYVADPRGPDGRHKEIRLVSLNPDKTRFPDIVLQPEDDESVTVVAKLIQPLQPGDFTRKPKPPTIQGRRDTSSSEGQNKIREKLAQAIDRFFKAPDETAAPQGTKPSPEKGWQSRFVLADIDGGGLLMETTPLCNLPTFVKKITLESGNNTYRLLPSNLRTKTWRFPVQPSLAPYTWSAGEFDDDVGADLATLNQPGFATDQATPFRIDAAGLGQRLSSQELTPGQSYRLLLPPSLQSLPAPKEGTVVSLEQGWAYWELTLPYPVLAAQAEELKQRGLKVGTATLTAGWVGAPPQEYRLAHTGERYPCFAPGDRPVIAISDIETVTDDEITLFVSNQQELQILPLPAGDQWLVELTDLAIGQYIAEVVPRKTSYERVRLPFEVATTVIASLPARVIVSLGIESVELAGSRVQRTADLSVLGEDALPLRMETPPCWPVQIEWAGATPVTFGTQHADQNGVLDTATICQHTRGHAASVPSGALCFDFGDLGDLKLQHKRQLNEKHLREQLNALVQQRKVSLQAAAGQYQMFVPMWFEPICKLLGYSLAPLPPEELQDAPTGCTARLLLITQQNEQGQFVSLPARILVLTLPDTDIRTDAEHTPRRWADRLCRQHKLKMAYLSDGLNWVCHETRKKHMQPTVKLTDLLKDDAGELFEGFLSTFLPEEEASTTTPSRGWLEKSPS